ncbi:MAG: hypothetical protein ACI9DF_003331 [Verrucomicrobiales bacterium]|jgi:hypothetical protein
MTKYLYLTTFFLATMGGLAGAATLALRYSFEDGAELVDTAGGNAGVLNNGATVSGGQLQLTGAGSSTAGNHLSFSSTINLGATFGATGVTIESWYTDSGTGTWGKLFQFGTNVAGEELAYTHSRGNGEASGVDRDGAKLFGEQVSVGAEHHLVITVASEGNINTWVDGDQMLIDIDTNDLSNVGGDNNFEAIGATSWGDPGMNGSVNEFRIWSGELTGAEVAASFAGGPANVVPEPSSMALISIGSVLLIFRRLRNR